MYKASSNMGANQKAVWDSIQPLIDTDETLIIELNDDDDLKDFAVNDPADQAIMEGNFTKTIFMETYASKEQLKHYYESLGVANYHLEEV